ncbi:hypothetical protein Scep_017628 [Stephania cephalantha]|uniref:Uncharacterized protein n=1 Tax=Stephania cephalantha TaxID=152367 RepID=A0AAP0IQT5_9MAGN
MRFFLIISSCRLSSGYAQALLPTSSHDSSSATLPTQLHLLVTLAFVLHVQSHFLLHSQPAMSACTSNTANGRLPRVQKPETNSQQPRVKKKPTRCGFSQETNRSSFLY